MAKKKDNIMVVKTLEDVVSLVNHNTEVLDRSIRKVARSSRKWKALGVLVAIGAIYTAVECRKQNEELYRLSLKIEKLENKEGE